MTKWRLNKKVSKHHILFHWLYFNTSVLQAKYLELVHRNQDKNHLYIEWYYCQWWKYKPLTSSRHNTRSLEATKINFPFLSEGNALIYFSSSVSGFTELELDRWQLCQSTFDLHVRIHTSVRNWTRGLCSKHLCVVYKCLQTIAV